MKKYTFGQHFIELKKRIFFILCFFIVSSLISYVYRDDIFEILIKPLFQTENSTRKIIYTGLAEAFISYVKLSCYCGVFLTIPLIALQIFLFISPGLYISEKTLLGFLLFMSPLLFYVGGFFVFNFVMPTAWKFFLSFESKNAFSQIILEAKISEYISLVLQFIFIFGLSFQLPVFLVIMSMFGIVDADSLKSKRRIVVVFIFIFAAIFTPPDILSQIALAIPLVVLYEISIILCINLERGRL